MHKGKQLKYLNPYRNIWYRSEAVRTPFVVIDGSNVVGHHKTLAEAMAARDRYERGETA